MFLSDTITSSEESFLVPPVVDLRVSFAVEEMDSVLVLFSFVGLILGYELSRIVSFLTTSLVIPT